MQIELFGLIWYIVMLDQDLELVVDVHCFKDFEYAANVYFFQRGGINL